MDWSFHDDGAHGGAWYRALDTDEHTPLPEGSLDMPFGRIIYSHKGFGQRWFVDGDARFWGAEIGSGDGSVGTGEDDPLLGILVMAEAWYDNLSGLNARYGYDTPEGDEEADAYVAGLSGQLEDYSPRLRGCGDRHRTSHLEL